MDADLDASTIIQGDFENHDITRIIQVNVCTFALMTSIAFASCTVAQTNAPVTSQEKLFPLRDIRLTGGPLKEQQDLNRKYLLKLEPDRLLSWFRKEAGLEEKDPPYHRMGVQISIPAGTQQVPNWNLFPMPRERLSGKRTSVVSWLGTNGRRLELRGNIGSEFLQQRWLLSS